MCQDIWQAWVPVQSPVFTVEQQDPSLLLSAPPRLICHPGCLFSLFTVMVPSLGTPTPILGFTWAFFHYCLKLSQGGHLAYFYSASPQKEGLGACGPVGSIPGAEVEVVTLNSGLGTPHSHELPPLASTKKECLLRAVVRVDGSK